MRSNDYGWSFELQSTRNTESSCKLETFEETYNQVIKKRAESDWIMVKVCVKLHGSRIAFLSLDKDPRGVLSRFQIKLSEVVIDSYTGGYNLTKEEFIRETSFF